MEAERSLLYARANRGRFLEELKTFLRFPSVSAQPAHAADVKRCAQWLAEHLQKIGLTVKIVPTARHPLVFATWLKAVGRPTVLIYGHYDVQPPEPLQEWRSPPFEPNVRGEDLFARGACDDKGQMFTHVKALESLLRTQSALPVNVKCLFEGEEEIGSPNLLPFVERNRKALAADAAVVSDTQMLGPDRPAISYAERGTLALELQVRGPRRDLHSGNFGGVAHNPLQALCEMISQLHGEDGRIAIPGIYDRVRKPKGAEREYLSEAGPSDQQILRNAGVKRPWGERGFTLYERLTLRPALTLNGITGGYQGSGGKGIIPAHATAKLSFRLVPDQKPEDVETLFREHIARITPATVTSSVRTVSRANPAVVDPRRPVMRAAASAYGKGFGAAPVFLRSGGTIPVVSAFQHTLKIPTVLMGFALPDDRLHAPNEKFHLPNFFNGVATSIWFLKALGDRP